MIVMLTLVKILQALSGVVSTLALFLVASGHWLALGTSAPLILVTVIAANHYRHQPDLITAKARRRAWRNGGSPASEPEHRRTNVSSSG